MGGTHNVVMGDRGRLVIPAEVRDHLHLESGTQLILIETSQGMLLLSQEQLTQLVRADLAGADLVTELLAERRRLAAEEDAA